MSKSNNIDPPQPDDNLLKNQPRGEVKILNIMLAEETALYVDLRNYQRTILRAKSENQRKEGGQVEVDQ
jgi:hypothetical protein